MYTAALLALAASLSTASAVYQGFNYGSTHTDGSAKSQSDFETEFNLANKLTGAPGFSSARLYTMIQGGTSNTPIAAIPAAIDTHTSLLLGLWASAGQANIDNEIAALKSAITQYGSSFTSLVAGISVGSEDLYRVSPTGIAGKAGVGAGPDEVANYISEVKKAIQGTSLSAAPVGHVDTWTAWVNSSNQAVIDASDFIGMDAYPYFQNTMANGIANGKSLFQSALSDTQAAVGGKPVWITETGWPVSGPTENQAVPSTQNAKTYWDEVGCPLFGKVNTWWYTVQDAAPTTPSPSFGLVAAAKTSPLYDLSCSNVNNSSSSAVSSSTASGVSSATGSAASATGTADLGSPALSAFSSVDAAASGASDAPGASGTSVATASGGNGAVGLPTLTTVDPSAGTGTGTGSGSGPNGTFTAGTATASSTAIATGGAVVNAGSVGGVFGVVLAIMAVL